MRVLVLGGYGGFGARVSMRLVAAGHDVLVGGRSFDKAVRFCQARERLTPVQVDRNKTVANAIAQHAPTVLVDAAGPFQGSDYHVPRACIEAGVHYLDLADGRDFVMGIKRLDHAARKAGVVLVSGASSVPALSGGVVRRLAADMHRVAAIEMAISSSNHATAGTSVAAAILSYVGQPMRLWRGGRWDAAHGWQGMRRETTALSDGLALERRIVALAEVPDLDLLPQRVQGKPSVSFRAGTELGFQNMALWLASWPVRWGWLASLATLAPLLEPLQKLTSKLGGDRSGMVVRVFGWKVQARIERRWTLIASDGDGPEIPAMAAPLLVEALDAGQLQPGARDAGTLLSLHDFEPCFAALAIKHELLEIALPQPLYQRVLGPTFDQLPDAVKAMHNVLRDAGAAGQATVVRGSHPLARLVAWVMRFPEQGEHAVHVHMTEQDGVETWHRTFSDRRFSSELSEQQGQLCERFGPLRFAFDLPAGKDGLRMVMRAWWLGPIRLPLALAPRSAAREWQENGAFHFDVPIALPGMGVVVHYRGWLTPL